MAIDRFTQLCLWTDESIALSAELYALFEQERIVLLELKGDALSDITMNKDVLVRRIHQVREQLRQSGKSWFGIEDSQDLEAKLTLEQKAIWSEKQAAWRKNWAEVVSAAKRSQLFLASTQRNLGKLVDHWRRLIGEAPLYSAKGQKVETPTTGRVLEAKY